MTAVEIGYFVIQRIGLPKTCFRCKLQRRI